MKALKKILIASLILSMLCAPFTACQKAPAEAEPTEDAAATTEGTGVETPVDPIVLCDASTSYYRIVRPVSSPIEVSDASNAIMEYPGENGARNLTLKWSSDKNAAVEHEILLGYTNRPESLEVLKSIDYDDFAIVSKNGKIVVVAHKAERMAQAAEYLCKNLLQIRTNENGQKEMVYLGDYVFTGSQKYLFNLADGNAMKDYAIVYPKDSANFLKAAETLQSALKETYGVELPIVPDNETERECEILLGKVDRDMMDAYFKTEEQTAMFSYVTAAKGKKLLIASHSDLIAEYMIHSFISKYVSSNYSYQLNLAADTEEIGNSMNFSESTALAEGANLRVMSFNILCELYADNAGIEGRQLPVVAPIFTYMPDILGMQEVSKAWYPELYPLFGDTYEILDQYDNRNYTNMSPLAYNTKTLTVLEHGAKGLEVGGNGHRVMSWGYFERKSDGARFVVINTHWNVGGDDAKTVQQTAQAKEMAEFALMLKNQYNCPIITTGDYNSRMSEVPVQTYVANSGFFDAGTTAKVINRAIKTTHSLFNENTRGEGEAIDHIFASSEVEILYYNVLIDKCLAPSSDHYPIYADIKLNK